MLNISLKTITIECCWNNVYASLNKTDKLLIPTVDRQKTQNHISSKWNYSSFAFKYFA